MKEKQIKFRYSSNLIVFNLIQWGGTIVCAFVLIISFRLLLNGIGMGETIGVSPFWDNHIELGVAIIILVLVMIAAFSVLFPYWLARKMTDSQGIASFDNDMLRLQQKNKT